MQTIEFETQPHNGLIKIPEIYSAWFEKRLKVILLVAESEPIPNNIESLTAQHLLESDLVGLWANRIDIPDTLTYARQLRIQAEQRGMGNL